MLALTFYIEDLYSVISINVMTLGRCFSCNELLIYYKYFL
jgi:hypothetical protein